VVRGVVPDQCVVAGVPAKIVREHTKAGWQPARAASRDFDLRLSRQVDGACRSFVGAGRGGPDTTALFAIRPARTRHRGVRGVALPEEDLA